jgi:hypothetical protein
MDISMEIAIERLSRQNRTLSPFGGYLQATGLSMKRNHENTTGEIMDQHSKAIAAHS